MRGDLILISEGDRVPAVAQLVQATDMQVDESLLTGESVPVRKLVADVAKKVGSGMTAQAVRPGGTRHAGAGRGASRGNKPIRTRMTRFAQGIRV